MSEKKNIDRLFQEKFKDFEVAPPERLWQNIEAELQEKKKKRVIPLWFRLSGVAAILVIGLLLSLPFFNGGVTNGKNPVVIGNGDNGTVREPSRITPTRFPVRQDQVVTDAGTAGNGTNTEGTTPGTATSGTGGNASKSGNASGSSNRVPHSVSNKNNAVAYDGAAGEGNRKHGNSGKNQKNRKAYSESQNAIAYGAAGNQNGRHKGASGKNNSGHNAAGANGAVSSTNNGTAAGQEGIAQNTNNGNNNNTVTKDKNLLSDRILGDAPVVAETPADTTAAVPEENALEKLLKEKELEKAAKKTAVADASNKWRIKPQMAPVYYNSLSQGSPIDSQFANNSKSYNNDMSYGIGIDYAVNDRISVRTGVNTVNLGYSTDGIQFYADMHNETNNISHAAKNANIVVQQQGAQTPNNTLINNVLTTQKFNGSMLQEMGYIEVPVEMSYKLLNKKFGIDIIGGVSTLFLNENNVSVISTQGLKSEIGEAENLNNIHFSTNLGVGFKYRFWKAFEANFEPTFKYQLNTFSSDAGNFKPYFIGLYSGISFSF